MITITDLTAILQSTGLPVAHQAFPVDHAPEMPFIIYQVTGSDNIGADNIVWIPVRRVQADLLCKQWDPATEHLIEQALTDAGIYWEREPEFDSDEKYYRSTYVFEIGG